jgi:hypothetical protein
MFDLFSLLWNTILLRPYVFGFLVLYLLSASLFLGVKKALVYTPLGYSIAWVSEWCSTHYGIPYGFYHYIPATMHRELWIGGIPFMDSLVPFFLHVLADATIRINDYAGVFFQISLFSITVFLYTLLVRKKAVKKLIILDLVFGTLLSFAIDLYFALLLAIVLF